jgi:biopolymer transport protein ExbB
MKSKTILLTLITIGFFAITAALHASDAPAGGGETPIHKKTLIEQLREGGWVMWPIFAISVGGLYFIIDGSLRTSQKRAMPPQHVEAVRSFFRQGDYVGAYNYCKANPSPFTNVCRVAVSMLGEGKAATEDAIVVEVSKENSLMQTFISYLSVIGVCAPMVGLLGTVTGMIRAFGTLGATGIGDPSSLSSAIGEVLVATASGLFIAIPAFGAFYFLRARAAKVLHDIQDTMASLLRKMPYDQLAGAHIGDEELYAAPPNWAQAANPAT